MDNIKKSIENWLNEYNNFSFKQYENMLDMELYMDQLITFLEKKLQIFQTSSLDKQITPSMINNYVKADVIDSPICKRYNREHLAEIEEVATLKNVLSIGEVKQIIEKRYNTVEKADIFNQFSKDNDEKIDTAVNEAFKKLNNIDDNDQLALINLALDFALTANAYLEVSKRILFYNKIYDLNNKE